MKLLGFLLVIFSFIKFFVLFVLARKDIRDYILVTEKEKDTIVQNILGIVAADGIIELIGGLMLMSYD